MSQSEATRDPYVSMSPADFLTLSTTYTDTVPEEDIGRDIVLFLGATQEAATNQLNQGNTTPIDVPINLVRALAESAITMNFAD